MSRLKLLILDACVVIQLHEMGRWEEIVRRCDVYLSEIVANREVRFDDANGVLIDLTPAIRAGQIHTFAVSEADIDTFRNRFDADYLGVIDDGEAESLAFLFSSSDNFLISSADRIVYRVLGNLHRQEQGISLEEVLNRLGTTASRLPRQYSKQFREQWSETGFQERLRGIGFRSDSAGDGF
ncbi:MAG: hypothetical protein NXI32_11240 [bacterium]|nr:hypothetical protein [bacterium]